MDAQELAVSNSKDLDGSELDIVGNSDIAKAQLDAEEQDPTSQSHTALYEPNGLVGPAGQEETPELEQPAFNPQADLEQDQQTEAAQEQVMDEVDAIVPNNEQQTSQPPLVPMDDDHSPDAGISSSNVDVGVTETEPSHLHRADMNGLAHNAALHAIHDAAGDDAVEVQQAAAARTSPGPGKESSGSLDASPTPSSTSTPAAESDSQLMQATTASSAAASASQRSQKHTAKAAAKRTRRNIMPRITKAERCGECHTCKNPQMKKACLTVRARNVEKLGESGDLPLSMLTTLPGGKDAGAPGLPPVRARQSSRDFASLDADGSPRPRAKRPKTEQQSDDPFTAALTEIMGSDAAGTVDSTHAPQLQRLFEEELMLERRLVLLDVLQDHCPPATMRAFVHGTGLSTLERWLTDAMEASRLQLADKVLQALKVLPVDVPALQTCTMGRTLSRMKKSGPEALQRDVSLLVAEWKKLVGESAPSAAPAVGDKRPRDAVSKSEASTKADVEAGKESDAQATAGKDRAAKAGKANADATAPAKKPGLAPRTSLDRPAADAAPKVLQNHSTASGPTAALRNVLGADSKKPAGPSAVLMAMDDDAIFKRPAAPPKPAARTPIVPSVHKVHHIKLLDTSATKELGKQRTKGASETDSPLAAGKPPIEFAGTNSSDTAKDRSAAAAALPLPSPASRNLIGGTTRIGGTAPMLAPSLAPLEPGAQQWEVSAAERARQAALRIPSPPRDAPHPRAKARLKSVSWAEEDSLTATRWFRRDDAPLMVRSGQDAPLAEVGADDGPVDASEVHPHSQFQHNAKREHWNEANALRQLAQEDDEEDLSSAQLAAVEPATPWGEGPPTLRLEPQEDPVGGGEESTERPVHDQRLKVIPPVFYPTLQLDPGTAAEPRADWETPVTEAVRMIPWNAFVQGPGSQQAPEPQQPPGPMPQAPAVQPAPAQPHVPVAPPQPLQHLPGQGPEVQQAFAQQAAAVVPGPSSSHLYPSAAEPPGPDDSQQLVEPAGRHARPSKFSSHPAQEAEGPWQQDEGVPCQGPASWEAHEQFSRGPGRAGPGGRGGRRPPDGHVADRGRGRGDVRGRGRDGARGFEARGRGGRAPGRGEGHFAKRADVPCVFFNSPQGCRKGDECHFAHVRSEQAQNDAQAIIERISRKPPPASHPDHREGDAHARSGPPERPFPATTPRAPAPQRGGRFVGRGRAEGGRRGSGRGLGGDRAPAPSHATPPRPSARNASVASRDGKSKKESERERIRERDDAWGS